ncbi:hypothetical protein SAMN05444682_10320 [Parapedobacter indicus]|uniref:Uncharacterized protein n=1 Tax=Parapedobacter indicus TaxID=1477437 RepID=A0A1I3GL37_9SPHI|nr:hypothetical protein CLV26_10321 [Parapedobacter indicus]SFI24174.1 hypothetical protein SAMN05444682_10320 [Parapedobacter indicus]
MSASLCKNPTGDIARSNKADRKNKWLDDPQAEFFSPHFECFVLIDLKTEGTGYEEVGQRHELVILIQILV